METKANYPFKFYTRLTLPRLTGVYAQNLKELLDGLNKADDSIIYYHTHHYMIQHRYSMPSSPSDFAYWITNMLGEELLGEEISSIDIFDFESISEYKNEIIKRIALFTSKGKKTRHVSMDERFNFMKAVSFIMSTGKEAYTLREFHDILKNITIFSVSYHFFESHFRLNSRLNDFSVWIRDGLKLPGLADKISDIDPYTMSMNGLKDYIIRLAESCL